MIIYRYIVYIAVLYDDYIIIGYILAEVKQINLSNYQTDVQTSCKQEYIKCSLISKYVTQNTVSLTV